MRRSTPILFLGYVICAAFSVGSAVAQPPDALVVEGDKVGIGTDLPVDRLHVQVLGSNGGVRIESAVPGNLPQFTLIEPSRTWRVRINSGGNFVFTDATAGAAPFQVYSKAINGLFRVGATHTGAGDVDRVSILGELFIGSSQVTPDYVFEPGYALESIEEHAELMWTNKHLPAVGGAQVEDGRHLIDVGAQQFGMLEELEKAHIYIEQLNTKLVAKEGELAALSQRNEELAARQEDLERRLGQLEAAVLPTSR